MSKVLIATTASDDEFQYYVPMFIYTCKRAYPAYDVKVFCVGELRQPIRAILNKMRKLKWCHDEWEVLENQFQEVRKFRPATVSSMRWILPDEIVSRYDYMYLTDADFLIFGHNPTLKAHMVGIMDSTNQCYAGARSAMYRPKRKAYNGGAWKRKYKRMIGGRFFVRVKDWLRKTEKAREHYRNVVVTDTHDKFDSHPFGAYREYDEVMLYRICRMSNIPTPRLPGKTLAGRGLGNLYRDIHLGDFKFSKRAHSHKKMLHRLKEENCVAFNRLEKDPNWQEIVAVCQASGTIREELRRLRKHVESRS